MSTSWKEFQPTWFKKTTVWTNTFRAACPLKAGMGGQFCLWRGQPCSYDGCPARVFEEVEIKDVSYMTGGSPSPSNPVLIQLNNRIIQLETQLLQVKLKLENAKISGKCSLRARFEIHPPEHTA